MRIRSSLVGDRLFYKKVLAISVPIMIQNGITNFVSLLDNIMVGRVGTEDMSGVAIANQLLMVFNLCIFGVVSAASIFGAQFYGREDYEGMRHTMRLRIYLSIGMTALAIGLFMLLKTPLINSYLTGDEGVSNVAETFARSSEYLEIMMIGLVPFALSQCYSSIMKEMGDTFVPMVASVTAVLVNLGLNYVLIFGKLGAPALGAAGAAIATVISRFAECAIVMIHTHRKKSKYRYIEGLFRSLKVPGRLVKDLLIKGTPLIINETLWAAGMAKLSQCYSVRSTDVIAGMNIASTIDNLFFVIFIALGSAIGIVVGPLLGANEMKEAKATAVKMIAFTTFAAIGGGLLLIVMAPLFPGIFNTDDSIRELATSIMRICGGCMVLYGFTHATYFTLRSGGKTILTFLFDSAYVWLINVPAAFLLANYTSIPILPLFLIVQLTDIIKCIVGGVLVNKGIWLNNIVE